MADAGTAASLRIFSLEFCLHYPHDAYAARSRSIDGCADLWSGWCLFATAAAADKAKHICLEQTGYRVAWRVVELPQVLEHAEQVADASVLQPSRD